MSIDSCKDCKFRVFENGVQNGCSLNKLEKLKSKSISYNPEYYSLDRACIFKRNEGWEGDIEKETIPRIGYLFIFKDKNKFNELKSNILKLNNPYWIGVIHPFEDLQKDIIELTHNKTSNNKVNIICDFYMDKAVNDIYLLDRFDKNYINAWTLVNIVGEEFNPDFIISRLNNFINNELQTASIILNKFSHTINEMCFFNIYYKYYKGSFTVYNKETDAYISHNLLQKAVADNSSLVKDWSEIK
jgi:hypothetical protein